MARLSFWYDFASTYSYLSAMRVEEACARAGVDLDWRPFLLGPIFGGYGWTTSPFNIFPAKGANMWRDMERIAADRGLAPIVKPDPFPQNSMLAARVALIGCEQGFVAPFTRAVYEAQFAQGLIISDPEAITALLSGIGQPGQDIVARAQSDSDIKQALRGQTEQAIETGLYGSPSFVTQDQEIFWGDDRLDQAIAWAARA